MHFISTILILVRWNFLDPVKGHTLYNMRGVHKVHFPLIPKLLNHLLVKQLHVRDRVMMKHDACTSGTSRVPTEASLQWFKVESLIPAPADCEVRFLIKILNAQSVAPIEIHRPLCQQSFPADFPLLVAQNCHGAFVLRKIVRQVGAEETDTRTKTNAHGRVSIENIVVHLFLHLNKFLPSQRKHFQNDREVETNVTQWFQSQAADFYNTGYKSWSHNMTNVSIPEVNMLKKRAQHLLFLSQ